MKIKLLILAIIGIFSANAQTTHNLDWFAGIGTNVDLTIEAGDTVIWTWTSPNHTVENVDGSSVETFNSGFLADNGSTFSHTFNTVGDNDYFCGIHGAASMSGTITVEANSGTVYNLDWERNITGTGSADLTIVAGDTVIWTWIDSNHTLENDPANSVETFNSGFLGPVGSTFSHTFTVVGINDYFCGIHGAASMAGTITVEENLGIDDNVFKSFKIEKNPVDFNLGITLSQPLSEGSIAIYDLLGKLILTKKMSNTSMISIDVSALNKGLYLVSINSENGIITKRFIKN